MIANNQIIDSEPTLTNCVSQLCTENQFASDVYDYWCSQIKESPRFHRKQWEFCYILQALKEQGVIVSGKKGLGFGVGKEPLVAVLASRGCQVLATDLNQQEAQQAGWRDTNQHAANLNELNEKGICPPEEFASRVEFRFVNMNQIDVDLVDFDFIWSSCALEHLGSIKKGLQFIINSLNCLKPGGIAVHTTEFNVSSNFWTLTKGSTVLFRKRDIDRLAKTLIRQGHKITLNYHLGNGKLDNYIDVPPYRSDPHLKLKIKNYVTTSIGLIIQKASN